MLTNLSQNSKPFRFQDGTYYGIVIDNNDPLHLQRCRIRIHSIHRNIPDSQIPWAKKASVVGQGSGGGIGSFSVPTLYTKVEVKFMDDSIMHPEYYASPETSDNVISLFTTNYPERYGRVDAAGNVFLVDTKSGSETITVIHKSGTTVSIDSSGNVSLVSAGNVSVDSNASITVTAKTNVTINAGGNILLNSSGVSMSYSSGNMTMACSGSLDLNAASGITIRAGGTLEFDANYIQTNTPAGGSSTTPASPVAPSSPASPAAVTPQSRPSPTNMENQLDY